MIDKIKHFYFNKYVVSLFSAKRYYISYNFRLKVLWFRVYKVASRTIDSHLKEGFTHNEYVYSSPVAYIPSMYNDYFKFAFVRDPIDRFVSAWRDKVVGQNYFSFNDDELLEFQDINAFIEFIKKNERYLKDIHFKTQTSLIDVKNIDYIGKFENFQEDFTIIASKIGVTFKKDRVLNKSMKVSYHIDKNNLEFLRKVYLEDFLHFYPKKL